MIKLATFTADSDIEDEATELAEGESAEATKAVDEWLDDAVVYADDSPSEQEMADELEAIEEPAEEAKYAVALEVAEKILQVPDSVRERDMRMIEAHQNDIRESRSMIRSRYIAWLQAKSEAKAAKDAYDEAVAGLLGIIDEGPVRQHSLFPVPAVTEDPPVVVEEGDTEAAAATLTTEEANEELPAGHYIHPDWQATPITEFFEHPDIDTNLIELTTDFEIETLGELLTWLDAEENADTIPTYLTDDHLEKVRATILESSLTTKKPAATAPTDDESWRTVSVDDLDIPKSLKETLKKSDFETVGSIADFTSKGKNLTDIKGVGEAKAEKIQDAIEKLWAIRKEIAENF